MRLSPLDIQNHHFGHRFRGYDATEVDNFLHMLTEDYDSLIAENESLKSTVRKLDQRVTDLLGNEKTLQNAIITAQSMTDDLRQAALKESEMLIAQTEIKAEKMLDASHRRVATMAEEIREMKMLKTRLASAVRNTIETHLQLLEGLAEEPLGISTAENKIAYLTSPKPLSNSATADNREAASKTGK